MNNIEQITSTDQVSFPLEVIRKNKAKRGTKKTSKSTDARNELELAPHVAILKEKIQSGAYSIDYDELATKILLYEL